MSTPPNLPDDTLELSPKPPKRSVLQKVTIVLSVILGLAFGLCTVSTMTTRSINDNLIITTALIIEAICILGLLIIAIIVIFRALRGDY